MINFAGEVIKKLSDLNRPTDSILYDLCIDGDTVIIPRIAEQAVLYYKLKFD